MVILTYIFLEIAALLAIGVYLVIGVLKFLNTSDISISWLHITISFLVSGIIGCCLHKFTDQKAQAENEVEWKKISR